MSKATNMFQTELTNPVKRASLAAAIRNNSDKIIQHWAVRHVTESVMMKPLIHEEFGDEQTEVGYRDKYIRPLIDLLCGSIEQVKSNWHAVYIDERRRYIPYVVEDERRAILADVLDGDTNFLLATLGPEMRPFAEATLEEIHQPLIRKSTGPKLRLALVGDCLMTEIRAFLLGKAQEHDIDLETHHVYFSANMGVAPNFDAVLDMATRGKVDLVALSYLTFEGIPPYRALLADAGQLTKQEIRDRATAIVRLIRESVAALRKVTEVPILLHSACGLPLNRIRKRLPFLSALSKAEQSVLDEINSQIKDLADATVNTFFIDEAALIGSRGLRHAGASLFPKSVIAGALFHTSNLGPLIADAYFVVLKAYALLKKTKVLLIDFDNTLWAGVMADGDVVHDMRAQKLLHQLREAGILLVALSKNDPRNIRWSEMALEENDFVLHKVNWNQKALSVEEVAQELNLGADSFVMIDDNPVERELVKQHMPAVVTLDPADLSTWPQIEYLLKFPNTTQTEEAKVRTEMYRAAAARREASVAELDYPAMMASLKLRARWRVARHQDLPRVHELIQRTNQFNTTTKRRSMGEFEDIVRNSAFRVYVAELGDRFGDLGLVGVVITELQKEELLFDSVVMSCRAMGFGLERLLVAGPLKDQTDWVLARGLFIPTSRNEPASSLFSDLGFTECSPGEWILSAGTPIPEVPHWLEIGN